MESFAEYQQLTGTFRLDTYTDEAVLFGLFSEAGELAGVLQKFIRGDFTSHDEADNRYKKELGDILWHVSEAAKDKGWTLAEIAQDNIDKLISRKERGTLKGSGDNR